MVERIMTTIEQYGNDSMKQDVIDPTKDTLPTLSSKVMFWRPKYLNESLWLEHIPFYFWLVEALKPQLIVESEVEDGSTLFALCQAVDKLNLDTVTHSFFEANECSEKVSDYGYENYREFLSLEQGSIVEAMDQYPNGSIDLFVMKDSATLLKNKRLMDRLQTKLSEKSIVIIHGSQNKEIRPICNKLKDDYETFEFTYGEGLLVVGYGSDQLTQIASFLKQSESMSSSRLVQNVYSRLGESCRETWVNRKLNREVRELEKSIKGFKRASELAEQDCISLSGKLEESVVINDQAIERAEKAEEANLILASDLSTKQVQLDELQDQLTHLQLEKADFEIEKAGIDKENSELKASLASRFNELAELTQIANSTDISLSDTKNAHKQVKQQLDEAIKHNQALLSSEEVLKQSLKEFESKINFLNKEKVSLQTQVKEAGGDSLELSKALDDAKNLESTLNLERQANKNLKKDNELLEADQVSAAKIISDQKREIIELEQSLQKRFDELATLTKLLSENDRVERQSQAKLVVGNSDSVKKSKTNLVTKIGKRRLKKKKEKRRLESDVKKIQESGLFDPEWYVSHYPESKEFKKGPVVHFLREGFKKNYNPSMDFSSEFYYALHQDVEEAGMNPLLHYIEFGIAEGREISKV